MTFLPSMITATQPYYTNNTFFGTKEVSFFLNLPCLEFYNISRQKINTLYIGKMTALFRVISISHFLPSSIKSSLSQCCFRRLLKQFLLTRYLRRLIFKVATAFFFLFRNYCSWILGHKICCCCVICLACVLFISNTFILPINYGWWFSSLV